MKEHMENISKRDRNFKKEKEMLGIKKYRNEKFLDRLISRLDMTEERISELETVTRNF